jgi:hypothetical protein
MSLWKRTPKKSNVDIEFTCPSAAELVSLYAELAESARYQDFEKFVTAVKAAGDKPNQNIVVSAKSKDLEKKLVGYLHAWAESSKGPGIVYEIAVSPNRRKEDIAKAMLLKLRTTYPEVQWRGHSYRISENLNRHLAVIRTLYAVALTFGFQKVVDATFPRLFPGGSQASVDHSASAFPPCPIGVLILLFAAIGLLGIRFFWAAGNIRRFLLHRVILLTVPNTRVMLFFHFPMLILHAVLFFFLCRFYQSVSTSLDPSYISGLLTVFIILLAMNVVWLIFLRQGRNDKGPEVAWILNNLAFAGLAALGMCLFCRYAPSPSLELSIVAGLLLTNSALDFFLTGGNYFLGDAFGGG